MSDVPRAEAPEKHAEFKRAADNDGARDESGEALWTPPKPHSLQSTVGKSQRDHGTSKRTDLEERRLKKERLKREAEISRSPRLETASDSSKLSLLQTRRASENNISDKIAHTATSDGNAKESLFDQERRERSNGLLHRTRDGVDGHDEHDDHDEKHAWRSNTEARRNLLATARRASPFHHRLHEAHIPHNAKILCINNKHDPRLRDANYALGTSAQCISKGFGAALHQHVDDPREFVKRFDAPYEKIINLDHLSWFKNSEPPPGKHRATLPMAFQKGFGAGSAALARKLKGNM